MFALEAAFSPQHSINNLHLHISAMDTLMTCQEYCLAAGGGVSHLLIEPIQI